jgi:hypothetical protein
MRAIRSREWVAEELIRELTIAELGCKDSLVYKPWSTRKQIQSGFIDAELSTLVRKDLEIRLNYSTRKG